MPVFKKETLIDPRKTFINAGTFKNERLKTFFRQINRQIIKKTILNEMHFSIVRFSVTV